MAVGGPICDKYGQAFERPSLTVRRVFLVSLSRTHRIGHNVIESTEAEAVLLAGQALGKNRPERVFLTATRMFLQRTSSLENWPLVNAQEELAWGFQVMNFIKFGRWINSVESTLWTIGLAKRP